MVEQSRLQPRSSWQVSQVANANVLMLDWHGSKLLVWQAAQYPSTKPSQKPADSRRSSQQAATRRQKTSPLAASMILIDGQYVRIQTSARGRGKKVPLGPSKPLLSTSSQSGLRGHYKAAPADSRSSPGDSRFFKSTNAVLVPGGAKNRPPSRKRPSGNSDVRYAPVEALKIPENLGGATILRLKRPKTLQKKVFPSMHQGARPGDSLRKNAGRW